MFEPGILKPGEKIKSVTSLREIESLLTSLYGLTAFNIVELNGYDDKNYKISVKCPESNSENEYTFKIMNSLDSKNTAFVEAQNEVMFFLRKRGIVCPKPIKNKDGKYYSLETFTSGQHVVRLLTYIPGTILYKTKPTAKTYYQIGQEIATLDVMLKEFHHNGVASRKHIWMLDVVPVLKQYFFVIKDDCKRKLFEIIIADFEEHVLKIRDNLEQGIIHGDFNEQNILTKYVNDELMYSGILDFGDVNYSCYLFELAIALTYMMIMEKNVDSAGYVIAGYSKIRTIPDIEFSLLKKCTMARICQSYIIGTYSSLQEPDNPYLLVAVKDGWDLLQKLLNESDEHTLHKWKSAAKQYNETTENSVIRNYCSHICKNRFGGKVAVVSGGTQGIGLSVARRLAQEGAKVVISSTKEKNVSEAVDSLAAEGLAVTGVVCHAGKKEERKIVLEKAAQLGGIDTLFLNSGINPKPGPILNADEPLWDKVFDINIKAQFLFVKEAMPLMKKHQGGSIILMSSLGAYAYKEKLGLYSVSKMCLITLTKVLANELASDDITVNCVAPAFIDTKFGSVIRNYCSHICKNRFGGKVAVVSGGTQGIGLSVARRLAQEGAKVVISSRKEKNVSEAVDSLAAEGLAVTGVVCHAGKKEERKIVLEKAAQLGGIDTLFLNSGINPKPGPILNADEPLWDKVFDVNIKAQFLFVKEAMPLMKKNQGGSIILMSSLGAYVYKEKLGLYSVSKMGIFTLTKVLANELASDDITVNCVAPAFIDTKFGSILFENKSEVIKSIPLNRAGVPEDVSGVIAFLASKDASHICKNRFDGKVAVVSGGTQGIGLSTARRLAQEGAKVIISSRKQKNVNEAVDVLAAEGLSVTGIVCHAGKKEERKLVFEKAAQLGGIDTLFLNSGINPKPAPLLDTDEALWDKAFDINIKAQFLFVKEAMPLMKKHQGGSIILMSTIGSFFYKELLGLYSVSKMCLLTLTKVLANELAPHDITVNCVAPAYIDTKFASILFENKSEVINSIPLKRVGVPEDVSGVIAFLASKDARFITGETFLICGGIQSRMPL
ncbi:hypothetical protein RN001_009170 [Aquatica leii]|uniref:Hydroxylysine kinase n=1 Tax=Aquatica leii TaxID=1421715 RepID=A0AAN7PTH3_9COLE|nr:hypothetical protein RN001_009170 [Aquatica leii]